MSTRSKGTREKYGQIFDLFCAWLEKSPDQIIEERKADLKKDDAREQRRYESCLKSFVVYLKETKGYSRSSQQVAWASVKSFFDTNYLPLQMRKGDYPKGEALGHRAFSKEELRNLVKNTKMSLRSKVIVFILKDSGLRVGDLANLTYGGIAKQLDANEQFVSIQLETQKAHVPAKTFIGPETVELLKQYINMRKHGTRRKPPELITAKSPLIRHTKQFSFTSRNGLSSLIAKYIEKIGLNSELSAHSLRKYTQTQLESAGVHPNWVRQILGHKLPNSEGSYSRPTDEQLRVAYVKAYDALRIFPTMANSDDVTALRKQLDQANERNRILEEKMLQIETNQGIIMTHFMSKDEPSVAKMLKDLSEKAKKKTRKEA